MRKPKQVVDLSDVIVITGRIDASTVAALRATLHAAVDRSEGQIVLDVSGVDAIDATGLGMLVGTQRRAHERGTDLLLRDVPVRMARLLKATRLERVLRCETPVPVGAG